MYICIALCTVWYCCMVVLLSLLLTMNSVNESLDMCDLVFVKRKFCEAYKILHCLVLILYSSF